MFGGLGPLEIIVLIIIFCILMFIRILNKKVIKSVSSKKHVVMPSNRIIERDSSDDHSNIESNDSTDDIESKDVNPATIIQNITYNIQDSAISGDINNEIKNN